MTYSETRHRSLRLNPGVVLVLFVSTLGWAAWVALSILAAYELATL